MEYTRQLFFDFLKKLTIFDKDCRSAYEVTSREIHKRKDSEKSEWNAIRLELAGRASSYSASFRSEVDDFHTIIDGGFESDCAKKATVFDRIEKCKMALAQLRAAEDVVNNKKAYQAAGASSKNQRSVSLEDLLNSGWTTAKILADAVNSASKKKDYESACGALYSTCRQGEALLEQELASLRSKVVENRGVSMTAYTHSHDLTKRSLSSLWNTSNSGFEKMASHFANQKKRSKAESEQVFASRQDALKQRIERQVDQFVRQFPPDALAEEYLRLYSLEPSFDDYKCFEEMPRNIHVSSLEYTFSNLDLLDSTQNMLKKHYPFLCRADSVAIPYCASFGPEFNYLFRFPGDGRTQVVKDACDLGMRLFMMLPPGKLDFTFIDPVTLGESFAMFTRLVDVDDRTSEVINGKIWSAPSDIEDKLRIMTNHISNVTQRCLQGKYDNIYEYNKVAEQNAEAYQVLMLMDYPAGLTDQSLKLIEQIVTSGPKCGVFTIIYRNESQFKKISERSHPLIANIESNFQQFQYAANGKSIACVGETVKGKEVQWGRIPMPNDTQLNSIIATLKKGIKNAEKVVIGIEKVAHAETTYTTKDGIRIPIGIHGANEVQYLTLGVGGSHHALIAGVAGSGKSSLLHTIILRTLTQYDPDELSIYLVDFKRGVEFKIYADFILPTFKVVAIESEREFGYNILVALEREQKIRADLFKKSHVDKIEEYRELGKKLPRVLVIMDEFHELFSNSNDELAKKSAIIMERIVRQGRAFGVHLILASQSYSNITGIDRAVFDQMAVRVVLKCSKADANILLDDGSTEIDQISIDDPGRAVYNSEAGNKEYNSHFRVAYIDPSKHRGMLQEISDRTKHFAKAGQPTRILLSNIEDNNYSIFNQFTQYAKEACPVLGRLYIGEPLSVTNNMAMDLMRREHSNLLMVGNDTEKARSMFAFAILSLCINYWVAHRKAPEEPFITLYNCKPLDDSYFKDTPKLIAEFLPEYVRYITADQSTDIKNTLNNLYDYATHSAAVGETDKFLFVFGYQRADDLKSDAKMSQSEDIDSIFNIMPNTSAREKLSAKDMFKAVVKDGAQVGVHTIIWQDGFNALYQDDNNFVSYFILKIAFDMSPEEFSRFVGANNTSMLNENNAIYYNKARDNQQFRPYQAPDEEWLKSISEKLK